MVGCLYLTSNITLGIFPQLSENHTKGNSGEDRSLNFDPWTSGGTITKCIDVNGELLGHYTHDGFN